jgi:septal ring factor EnvC (AmiA/AmiB activator)
MLAYYGYFGRARAERIRGIQDQLEHLALVREKIVAEKTRLDTLEQQREQRVASLKSSQEQRAKAVSAIDQSIKTRGSELKRLQSQAKGLEKLIVERRRRPSRPAGARARRVARWPPNRRSNRCAASCHGRCRTARCSPGSASPAREARCAGRAC